MKLKYNASIVAIVASLFCAPVQASLSQDEKEELALLRKQKAVLLQDLKDYDAKLEKTSKTLKQEQALKEKTLKDINVITPKLIKDFKEIAEVNNDSNAQLNAMKKLELVGMSDDLQNRFEEALKRYYRESLDLETALLDQFYNPKSPRGHKIIDVMKFMSEERAKEKAKMSQSVVNSGNYLIERQEKQTKLYEERIKLYEMDEENYNKIISIYEKEKKGIAEIEKQFKTEINEIDKEKIGLYEASGKNYEKQIDFFKDEYNKKVLLMSNKDKELKEKNDRLKNQEKLIVQIQEDLKKQRNYKKDYEKHISEIQYEGKEKNKELESKCQIFDNEMVRKDKELKEKKEWILDQDKLIENQNKIIKLLNSKIKNWEKIIIDQDALNQHNISLKKQVELLKSNDRNDYISEIIRLSNIINKR